MRMQEALAALAAGPVVNTTAIKKVTSPTTADENGKVTSPTTGPQRTVSLG